MTAEIDYSLPALGSRGVYAVTLSQAQASAGSQLVSGPKRLLGWSVVSGAASTTEAAAQVTSPGATTTIVQLTGLPAGDYSVSWNVELGGTLAAADANNIQLLNGVTVVLQGEALAVAGLYPQPGVVITVPAAGSITVQTIGAATVGAVYRSQLVVSLLAGGAIGSVLDGAQTVGVISTGQDQVDVQWMGDDGIYIGTAVAVLATVGKLSGCIYVRDTRE